MSLRLPIYNDVILYAGGDGVERGLDIATGKILWGGTHEKSGYRSPEDLIVAGGLVWNAGTTSGGQSGEFTGRDPKTGEVKKQYVPSGTSGENFFFTSPVFGSRPVNSPLCPPEVVPAFQTRPPATMRSSGER